MSFAAPFAHGAGPAAAAGVARVPGAPPPARGAGALDVALPARGRLHRGEPALQAREAPRFAARLPVRRRGAGAAAARPQGARAGRRWRMWSTSPPRWAPVVAMPLAQARRFVARAVGSGGNGDRYAIIAAGASPVRLAGPSAPGPSLDEAIEKLAPQRHRRHIDAALDPAASLVATTAGGCVVLVTDGGASSCGLLLDPRRAHQPAHLRAVVAPTVGIVALRHPAACPGAGRRAGGPDHDRDLLRSARVARVSLRAEGHEIVERRVDLPAHGDAEVRVRVLASIASLSARVTPDDGIADALRRRRRRHARRRRAHRPARSCSRPPVTRRRRAAFFVEEALVSAGTRRSCAPPRISTASRCARATSW